ncbi:MAG TPA: hypothetical protein VK797_15270 [Tepidisphaeraceae bacterium]|jgi:hypothetical protein|nr:hypothetical protein [Tepidisphaeraceae bacterium]
MTGDVQQIGKDLEFVRNAVSRRARPDLGPPLIFYLWAVYVIVGYSLFDLKPEYANSFLGIGGMVGGVLSWVIGRRYSHKTGQWDRALAIRGALHMGGGIMLGVGFIIALSSVSPGFRPYTGQVMVGFVGLTYFLWGVHFHRYFMLLGPVVMAGGAVVGMVPHFGWTALGVVISLGLILPTFFAPRHGRGAGEVA